MLKNILNLEGAVQLSKAQQSHVFGGGDAFIGGVGCVKCKKHSDCGTNGACIKQTSSGCEHLTCGCGSFC